MIGQRTGRRIGKLGLAAAGVLAGFAAAPHLAAQDEEAGPPEGWMVRTDRGGDEMPGFADMPPGFHITTGPAAIFYHPDNAASGEFSVEAEVFLFDPGRRNEGFGVFIGGGDLQGDGQVYTYFLIRRDGSVLVKRRDGAETSVIHGWTPRDAVVTWEERAEDDVTARNVLGIAAMSDEIAFSVNGETVFSMPREGQHVDGLVGLRVNHGLNLHFSSLEITQG